MRSLAFGRAADAAAAGETLPPGGGAAARPRRRDWAARFGLSQLKDSGLDLRNTWQVVAGALLLPLGVAVILLGWSGAAHGRVDQQQIPYIISGGVLGLACIMVGCFFFWAHWLYRIYDQADLHHQEAMRENAELRRALLQVLGERPATATSAAGSTAAAAADAGTEFVATPTGTNFHDPSCPIVVNRTASLRRISRKEAAGMRPCRICEPH